MVFHEPISWETMIKSIKKNEEVCAVIKPYFLNLSDFFLMKTNTFILIVTVYSLLLGLPAIVAPMMASDYFGQASPNANELSLFNFLGGYQLAMGYLGYVAYRSTDKATRRGWLLSIVFLTVLAEIVYFYNLNVRHMVPHKTLVMDMGIWAIMAIGALYFWNKEK